MKGLVDYHIHTKLCGHAQGEMEQYVQMAITKELKEMGFADHVPMYFRPPAQRDATVAMSEAQVPDYLAEIQRLQVKYPQITIKCGIEADFTPGQEKQLADLLAQYNFDYVLGSIHFLDGWGFDDSRYLQEYEKWSIEQLYTYYFTVLKQAAESGLFDVLAHPDLVKKFGFRPSAPLDAIYEEVVSAMAQADLCVEVNTAGLRYPVKEMYPTREFLEVCWRHQVPVSLGSDAHAPEQVGKDFEQAVELLKSVGYRQIVTFQQRKRQLIDL